MRDCTGLARSIRLLRLFRSEQTDPERYYSSIAEDAIHRTAPFSILDELNCYFDSAAEPNNVHLEVWLPGHLCPEKLGMAAAAAAADVPAVRARRAPGAWWRANSAWQFPLESDIDPVSVAGWRNDAELDSARARFLSSAPDLDRSPPFRLLLAQGPQWDSVILSAHHAAFDGRSCLRLLSPDRGSVQRGTATRRARPRSRQRCRCAVRGPGSPAPRREHITGKRAAAARAAHGADSAPARGAARGSGRAGLRSAPARVARGSSAKETARRIARYRQRPAHRRAHRDHHAVEHGTAPADWADQDQHARGHPATRSRR